MATSLQLLVVALAVSVLVSGAQAQEKSSPADKETVAPDIKAEALWEGRKIAPFRAMDFPKMVKASEADFIEDSEYVLALTVNGESRAYPSRFAWWHHVINDKIGKPEMGGEKFVTITYCNVCNTGIRFDPVVGGKPKLFDFYGLYNGVVTMYDRETDSVWLQVTGRAVKGPMVGTTLKIEPLLDTTWGKWKAMHPDTLIMSPDTPYSHFYKPKGTPTLRGYKFFPLPFFQQSLTRADKRLPAFDMVLGVVLPESNAPQSGKSATQETPKSLTRAYPIKTLAGTSGVLDDTLGTTPLSVFYDADVTTAVAVSRVLDGKTLTFETRKRDDGTLAIYDKETGTRWSFEGKGEEGALTGKSLRRLDSFLSQWYGWVAYYPETSIYGRADAPQPVDPSEVTPEKPEPAPEKAKTE